MFGVVQLGVLAACIVLFLPMGMAGWHLSRNKMLFFSGALFITLAVFVHLTPYFPALIATLSYSSSSSSDVLVSPLFVHKNESCIYLLHEIEYHVDELSSGSFGKSWNWVESSGRGVSECGFQKLDRMDVSDLLNGSWVVVAGDSQARLMVVSLLELVLGVNEMETVKGELFKRHSDYKTMVDEIGMKLDFIWAPYIGNLTDMMREFKEEKSYPDVLVMGAGLWDMLHVTNVSDYLLHLKLLKNLVMHMIPVSSKVENDVEVVSEPVPRQPPHLFWLGMPTLVHSMLNTEEKREKMTNLMLDSYIRGLYSSKLVRQTGGPLLLLDVHSLSRKCGIHCTLDGMHYDGVVYDTIVHIMLNALLIESHQKL
ncbi:acetyltransferase [Lithospermum erythrorhizon]|uniref:Acetyltransferase n=1 Tax=Lithospermum erythrorhizon TaxID=34254 RepID=A0AAV3QAP5_LITER